MPIEKKFFISIHKAPLVFFFSPHKKASLIGLKLVTSSFRPPTRYFLEEILIPHSYSSLTFQF